jgi:hypothetical protein
MYGTIFRMKVKLGNEKKLVEIFDEWEKERGPKVKGYVTGFMMKPDKGKAGELIGVAVFKDKQSYMANADNPEEDKWYQKWRHLLSEDPVWEDGEYITGGSA